MGKPARGRAEGGGRAWDSSATWIVVVRVTVVPWGWRSSGWWASWPSASGRPPRHRGRRHPDGDPPARRRGPAPAPL